MKTNYKIAIALVTGAAIGGAAIQGLHAQAKPPGFTVLEIDVKDAATYAPFQKAGQEETLKQGGRFLVQGGTAEALVGAPPKRIVIVQWASVDAAKRWYNSAAMKPVNEGRAKTTSSRIFVAEGKSN
jgi:uncharacterized protein (DUF1330 family)